MLAGSRTPIPPLREYLAATQILVDRVARTAVQLEERANFATLRESLDKQLDIMAGGASGAALDNVVREALRYSDLSDSVLLAGSQKLSRLAPVQGTE